jgi:alanine dehydrogenase
MTLVLDEGDVARLLSMREAVAAVEECFRQRSLGMAFNTQRTRTISPGGVLNVMHASLPYLGRAGAKCYMSTRRGTTFAFLLFGLESGELLSVMGADMLGRFRTGAASAVATKYLFGRGELELGIAGSGRQALTQVLAIGEVAKVRRVRAWGRSSERLSSFVGSLSREGFDAVQCETLRDAFLLSDVAVTITSSSTPFVSGDDLSGVSHMNACGSNWANRSELTPDAVSLFRTVVADDIVQAKSEAGDLVMAASSGKLSWDSVFELCDVVSGRVTPQGKTLFKSTGVAIEDVAVASVVYDRAVRERLGRELDIVGPS